MKNTVDAAAFYKAMTALMEVPSKSSIEVLREIKAEFTGDQCVLSATDLNTWMSVTLPASGDSFGFVFRNSANIQKICRHYDGALELELQQRGDESFLTMRSGSKGGEFPVYDTKDCPVWPKLEVKQTYAANAAKLLACVKQVKYAVGSRNVRPEYQGVLFQNKHIWAVEGHRAGCCDDGGLDVEPSFVVGVPELEQLKAFGRASIVPSFFRISEPAIFGAPIIFNPILMIPFVLGGMISALLYWGAVSLGLVSNFYILVSGTFPIFVQGFVQCLDPRIWVFTIVLIVVMAVVWYPFFKVYDNQLLAQEQENAAAASAEDAE